VLATCGVSDPISFLPDGASSGECLLHVCDVEHLLDYVLKSGAELTQTIAFISHLPVSSSCCKVVAPSSVPGRVIGQKRIDQNLEQCVGKDSVQQAPVARLDDSRAPCLCNASCLFVFAATIRQFQLRFAASARKKSLGSASPVFAVYKARSEQPFFVVWGPWTVPGLQCKKSP
jgi:hypothetical protein